MALFRFSVRAVLISALLIAFVAAASATTRKSHVSSSSGKKKTVASSTSSLHSRAASSRTSSTRTHASKSRRGATRISAKGKGRSKQVARSRGQQGIAPERAREIQEALIKANYLSGEPSGIWDSTTQQAMTRFQADNGWQNKIVPDSRALIKLGLGPNHSNLINPEFPGVGTTPPAVTSNSSAQLQPGGATSN